MLKIMDNIFISEETENSLFLKEIFCAANVKQKFISTFVGDWYQAFLKKYKKESNEFLVLPFALLFHCDVLNGSSRLLIKANYYKGIFKRRTSRTRVLQSNHCFYDFQVLRNIFLKILKVTYVLLSLHFSCIFIFLNTRCIICDLLLKT